ncbi:MAG TPA: kelch repeat-containing protein [Steroidobacteraceae bacterium]|nr:kelch repeat-containing protein [Steroidobacteraceae bacterium]
MTGRSSHALPGLGAAIRYPALLTAALALVACGGSSNKTPSYTIAGELTGLTAGSVVLANGKTTVTVSAGTDSWEFPGTFAYGSLYLVTVQTQPADEMCLVTSSASGRLTADVTDVVVACSDGLWTWQAGSNSLNAPGIYGTQGSASASNAPGAREAGSTWTDSAGNLWLFGGYGYAADALGELNDLWQYSPSTAQWTWVSGGNAIDAAGVYGTAGMAAAGNLPGARQSASSWIDPAGNLWLFGGYGYGSSGNGDLNDLWQYSPSTGLWTWVSGGETVNAAGVYGMQGMAEADNVPGAREGASSWVDSSGNLWLFGGYGRDSTGAVANLNDLWQYDSSTGLWTWVSGGNTINAAGVYGTQGVASASNVPGARQVASTWTDSAGNLWLFGGYGFDSTGAEGDLNDLWQYSPSTGEWTWVSGSDEVNATGVYGMETAASAANMPGARQAASTWIDSAGNLWMFGGYGYDSTGAVGDLGDLWEYVPGTGQWRWVSGGETSDGSASYGTEASSAASNLPGSRRAASSWIDASGNLWLFGGAGYGTSGSGYLNDLWEYSPSL